MHAELFDDCSLIHLQVANWCSTTRMKSILFYNRQEKTKRKQRRVTVIQRLLLRRGRHEFRKGDIKQKNMDKNIIGVMEYIIRLPVSTCLFICFMGLILLGVMVTICFMTRDLTKVVVKLFKWQFMINLLLNSNGSVFPLARLYSYSCYVFNMFKCIS